MFVSVSIDPADVLGDIPTDELVAEILRRSKRQRHEIDHADIPAIIDKLRIGHANGGAISEIMHDLMSRRRAAAEDGLRRLIATMVPAELLSALDAMTAGREGEAICLLDRALEPSPAATATELPLMEARAS